MEIKEMEYREATSVINWLKTMVITIIPGVNIVMMLIWAFGDETEASKANWAKAQLIWIFSVIILVIIGVSSKT